VRSGPRTNLGSRTHLDLVAATLDLAHPLLVMLQVIKTVRDSSPLMPGKRRRTYELVESRWLTQVRVCGQ
jgi:hypothetical protein